MSRYNSVMHSNVETRTSIQAGASARGLDWDSRFVERHPLFAPLAPLAPYWSQRPHWPDLQVCNALLQSSIARVVAGEGHVLRAVSQKASATEFAHHYEVRIHHRGELQTRARNWHDWFNLLVWRTLPQSKRALNIRHCEALQQATILGSPLPTRNARANACTLFDENGAIVLASDSELLDLVREFRWRDLFWARRSKLNTALRCLVFGHSLYEKALRPYVGMTAHAILIPTDESLLKLPWPALLAWLDGALADFLTAPQALANPRQLQPFPLLGIPGWDPANENAAYYENTFYFRRGRRRHPASPSP